MATTNSRLGLRALRLLALVAGLLSALPAGAQPGPPQDLLTFLPPQALAGRVLPSVEGAVRSQLARIEPGFLAALSPQDTHRVRLPLFPDRAPIAILERRDSYADGGYVWVGKLEGDPYSEVYVSVAQGDVYMKVRAPGQKPAELRALGDDLYLVFETDYPEGPFEEESALSAVSAESPDQPPVSPAEEGPPSASSAETHIDVVVFYTDDARAAAGSTGAILATIQAAVSQTNSGHTNTITQTRFRLVHTQETSYAEGGDIFTDLSRLAGTTDGFMDEIHAARDQYGADLVHLFTESTAASGSTIGLAHNPGQFGVTKRSRALDLVFEHEIGHNLGACHQIGSSTNSICQDPNVGRAWSIHVVFGSFITVCEYFTYTVMWSTISSNQINYFSDPLHSRTYSCIGFDDRVRAVGSATSNNRTHIDTRRMLSSVLRQPLFYVQSTAGEGNATYLTPENDVADVYNEWFPLTEPDPATNANVWITPGNYSAPLFIDEKSTLNRWGSSGSVVLGQ